MAPSRSMLLAAVLTAVAAEVPVLSWEACKNPAQIRRPCTTFEANPAVCLCPGKGHRVDFELDVTEAWIPNLPGAPTKNRQLLTFNGSSPGPTLTVTEGDWVVVRIRNRLPANTNYTSIAVHFHGIDQALTLTSDGVAGATQCAVLPGDDIVYNFRASAAGTFWYHGHKSEHYIDGLYGVLVVKPLPSSPQPPAHDDEWVVTVSDFHALPARDISRIFYMTKISEGDEPTPDAIAVNGVVSTLGTVPGGHGLRFIAPPRGRTLIRFVAANAFSVYNISIDGCLLRVVEIDGTAVEPLPVAWVPLNIGQRVSVIVDWSPVSRRHSSVYMRVRAIPPFYARAPSEVPPYLEGFPKMRRLNTLFLATVQFGRGIIKPNYNPYTGAGAPPRVVLSPAQQVIQRDLNLAVARPVSRVAAPRPTHGLYLEIILDTDAKTGVPTANYNGISGEHLMNASARADVFTLAGVYGAAAAHRMSSPASYRFAPPVPRGSLAEKALAGLTPIRADAHGRYLIPAGAVVTVFWNNTDSGQHPMHLHGHPFFLASTSANPPGTEERLAPYFLRRDVATLLAGGWGKYIVVADYASILMIHCHIDWHMRAGLMAEMVIAPELLYGLPISPGHRAVCKKTLAQPGGHGHLLA